MTLEIITSEALKLGWRERLELIQTMLKSIAIEKEAIEAITDDSGLTEEQAREIDRRMAEFDGGKVKAIPGDIVLAEITQKYGLQL